MKRRRWPAPRARKRPRFVDPDLLSTGGIAATARVDRYEFETSLSCSLVDPGCVCTLSLLVARPSDSVPYRAWIQQRMSRPSSASLLWVGAVVPVWIDPADDARVAVDLAARRAATCSAVGR